MNRLEIYGNIEPCSFDTIFFKVKVLSTLIFNY